MAAIKKDPLQVPIDHLQRALTEPSDPDARSWTERVRNAVAELRQGLKEHESGAESPNGALSVLNSSKQDTAPILDRKVQQFRFEHLQFMDSTRELIDRLDTIRNRLQARDQASMPAGEIAEVQQTGTTLLNRVREHQEAESKLMIESITQDTGVGD